MIKIKTLPEIEQMARGGKILHEVMGKVLAKADRGVSTLELDGYADELIKAAGAVPSFKGEKGYGFATCMNVDAMVVHGVPRDYKLQDGDILGVDLGVYYQGWHTDASWTTEVKSLSRDSKISRFLRVGEEALEEAVKQCVPGKHIGDISQAMENIIRQAGYSPVKQLVGHGIGRELHEDPEIPCYLRGKIANTPEVKVGMVLAIEVIYNQGQSAVVYENDDGWTIITRDGLPSGLFEHTVAITAGGPRVLA